MITTVMILTILLLRNITSVVILLSCYTNTADSDFFFNRWLQIHTHSIFASSISPYIDIAHGQLTEDLIHYPDKSKKMVIKSRA